MKYPRQPSSWEILLKWAIIAIVVIGILLWIFEVI